MFLKLEYVKQNLLNMADETHFYNHHYNLGRIFVDFYMCRYEGKLCWYGTGDGVSASAIEYPVSFSSFIVYTIYCNNLFVPFIVFLLASFSIHFANLY